MTINFPNALALFRIAMVVPIMAFTRADELENQYLIAAALFLVASFTDFLDGYWARRTTGGTVLGAFLDTTADKIMVTGVLLALVSVDLVS
ncbi:MAG TPA: CDP-alcohol phosphatidyltransferase family protein, partial [Acidimicrobiia bacterium]|nr:CDP-alcohol phosphatidyltransferase family protein [Acidimicrobiia bacterium]